jgi:hypothetical protein
MTSHLTPDELIDAVDGTLAPLRRAHLDTCEACHQEAATLRGVLGEVRVADVPEPSPLFWDHLSARVRAAIADETAGHAPAPVRRWFQWPVLAPLAGLASVLLALIAGLPAGAPDVVLDPDTTIASAEAEPFDIEMQWALVADLVGDLDIDAAHEAGIATSPGVADAAVLELSVGEQQELVRLLHEELRVGS